MIAQAQGFQARCEFCNARGPIGESIQSADALSTSCEGWVTFTVRDSYIHLCDFCAKITKERLKDE